MQTRLIELKQPLTNIFVNRIKENPILHGSISLIDGQIFNNNEIIWNNVLLIGINNIKINSFPGYLFIHYKFQEILNFCWTSHDQESLIYTIPAKSRSKDWKTFLAIDNICKDFKILADYPDEYDNTIVPDNAPKEFKFQLIESYIKSLLTKFGFKKITNFWSGEWTK